MSQDNSNNTASIYVQGIRVTFSNGRTGEFVGRAVVTEDEMDTVTIAHIEVGGPEKFDDHVKESLLKRSGRKKG